jgi:hypothetical protein
VEGSCVEIIGEKKKDKKKKEFCQKKETEIEKDEELESATLPCVPTDGRWMVGGVGMIVSLCGSGTGLLCVV